MEKKSVGREVCDAWKHARGVGNDLTDIEYLDSFRSHAFGGAFNMDACLYCLLLQRPSDPSLPFLPRLK